MLEQRNLKIDLAALALLAVTVFLGASLLSYDPADPPNSLVYPTRTQPANICGRSGALVSAMLFDALGLGAYYLLVSLAVVDAMLLVRRGISQPVLRGLGWLLSLVGFTTLAAMALPQCSPGPVIGSGGYLGAAGRGLLEMHFANVGAYILVCSLILGGLLLSTDYVVVWLLAWGIGIPAKGLGRGVVRVGMAYSGKLIPRRSDLEPYAEDAARAASVRISRRPAIPPAEEPAADATQVSQESAAADSEALARTAAPATLPLRIRKPAKAQKEKILADLDAASGPADDYELPTLDLLLPSEPFCFEEQEKDVRRKAHILEKTFADFGFNIRVVEIQTGPVIAQFEVELEAGLRLSRITGLADDLAIALRVPSVRIVAPLPGKNTVGIEVPNSTRQLVRMREVMEETSGTTHSMRIPIFLGKDVAGNPMVVDLATLPHLLIAGRTGTGKSVCLNSIIVSLLMTRRPDEVRMLLIDPKMVELSPYKNIPHLMHPVVTDMRKAEAILGWAVEKMEERYHLLARAGVRHISVYNQLGEQELMDRIQPDDDERPTIPRHIPYIVIVADEMADLMMTSAKEVEGHIIRLAQKSRAVGIHLVAATQKPTVDVITGLIKSNLPARICFQVASRTDSRVVLDEMGADKLLGNGDMLFLWPGTSTLLRGQGTYLSDDEIARVIARVATAEPQFVKELVQLKAREPEADAAAFKNRDDLYEAAVDIVVREGRGSVSLLQRALGIGYGRAARLIDFMAEDGLIGPYNGSQAREVLISLDDWEQMRGRPPSGQPSPPPRRANKISLAPPSAENAFEPSPSSRTATATRPTPKPLTRAVKPVATVQPQPDDLEEDDLEYDDPDDRPPAEPADEFEGEDGEASERWALAELDDEDEFDGAQEEDELDDRPEELTDKPRKRRRGRWTA